jgi:hypothetical protein
VANVYSTQFVASHAGEPASFECPQGYRAVLRCITGFNANLADSGTLHVIHSPSDCTIIQWVIAPPAALQGAESIIELMHFVFNAGEAIYTSNDDSVDCTLSGFLLTLP